MADIKTILNDRLEEKQRLTSAFSLMINLLIGSSALIFLALILVWLTRSQSAIMIPSSLKWNTILIVCSSLIIEKCHSELKTDNHKHAITLMNLGLLMGLSFSVIQIFNWFEIVDDHPLQQNIFLPITIVHFLHIVIGLLLLIGVRNKIKKCEIHSKNLSYFKRVNFFWHYLGVLWIFILVIL